MCASKALKQIFCLWFTAALAALVAKDTEEGTKAQTKFFGKTFPKLHPVIMAMFEMIGEKEALEVVEATTPAATKQAKRVLRPRGASKSKTPQKKTKKVSNTHIRVVAWFFYSPVCFC